METALWVIVGILGAPIALGVLALAILIPIFSVQVIKIWRKMK